MKNEKTSMQYIANMLNISKVTVHKALNNQPGVSQELRNKIIDTANKLGYVNPNSLKAHSYSRFAFVVPKKFFLETDNFYSTIFYNLNKICTAKSLNLNLYVINSQSEKQQSIPQALISTPCDGIFVAGEFSKAYVNQLITLDIPIVLIDFYKPILNLDCVVTDNFYIGYKATNYLLENGHRRIGFLGDKNNTSSISDRYFGYLKALDAYDISFDSDIVISNDDPITNLYTLDIDLPENMPTAFVCHCDMAAYYLMQKLAQNNIKVPDDVSIISFDNTDISESTDPKITSIDINKEEFAVKAYNQMADKLKNPDTPAQRLYTHTKLIVRESVRLLNQKKSIPKS